jgi:hypothetical protein
MHKALSLLEAKLSQGLSLLTAAHQVSKELGFGPSGYVKLVLAYQSKNEEINHSR